MNKLLQKCDRRHLHKYSVTLPAGGVLSQKIYIADIDRNS